MKPHAYQADLDAHEEDDERCALCNEYADHPIHELDGVAIGGAEDEFVPPDEVDSGFDVRDPETVTGLFEDHFGQELP